MRLNASILLRGRSKEPEVDEKNNFSKYEGLLKRCASVYFTAKGLLLFHCVLCENEELTDVKELCEHLTNEHQNVFTEKDVDVQENVLDPEFELIESEKFDEEFCILNESPEDFIEVKNDTEENDDDEDFLSIVEYTITPVEEINLDIAASESKDLQQKQQSNNNSNEEETEVQQNNTKSRARAGPRIKNTDGERRYKCTMCGLAFKEGYNLRQHLRRHSEAERFKCSQCSKRFHTRTELNTHLRRHTGETPFMCAECGRQFVTSGALTQHMRRHQNLRPCECDVCGKRFFDTSQLKHHYIVHTRERTHACPTCNTKFARRKALVTHMKIHANKREYVCHICQTGFNQAPGLRMHLRSKHKDVLSVQEMLNKDKKNL